MMMAVNRGIEFAKAQGGIKLAPNMTSFCLAEVVAMPLQIIESIKSKTSVELVPLSSDIYPQVISDMHWLRENILCLVSNALKYSLDGTSVTVMVDLVSAEELQAQAAMDGVGDSDSDGSIGPAAAPVDVAEAAEVVKDVEVSGAGAQPRGPALDAPANQLFLRITVMDRGIGIPDAERKKLFRPFQQAQRLAGGTGLGLFSLSKRMEALGGHRGVTPRPDGQQGSVFWFAFPYRADTMAEYYRSSSGSDSAGSGWAKQTSGIGSVAGSQRTSAATSGAHTPSAPSLSAVVSHLNILIVDDSLSILKVTERAAKQAGHHCETAANGAIALERLQLALPLGEIDIVLIDFQMPVMDGPTCVTRYRAFEADLLRQLEVEGLERQLEEALRQRDMGEGHEQEQELEEGQEQEHTGVVDVDAHRGLSATVTASDHASASVSTSTSASLPLSAVAPRIRFPHRVPIIGMSANSDDENRRLGLAAGMDQFISKPFSMKDLQPLLDQVFRASIP